METLTRMKQKFLQVWRLVKETSVEWYFHNTFLMAGALAYYTIFSLAPILLIVLYVVRVFWQQADQAQAQILQEIESLVGPGGADMIETMLQGAQEDSSGGIFATVIGIAVLLFGATAVFIQLRNAMNEIWDVELESVSVGKYLLKRLLSLGLVIAVGFLLLVSLIISALLSALDQYLQSLAPQLQLVTRVGDLVLSFGVITVVFALIYRYIPDLKIAWQNVWIGAAITALLFTLGKYGIGVYLGNAGISSAYGAAGSFAVLLVWIYYSSLIFFYGAVFTRVYARHHGLEPERATDQKEGTNRT